MSMSDSLFPVMEESIKVEGLKNSTDYKFIINAETSEVLSCMTNEYKLVTNEDVIKKAMPVLKDNGAVLSSVNMFNNGARTTYRYRFPKITVKIDKDELNPEVIIKNSYDGSTNVDALAGAFRLVCSNGLIIGRTYGHTKNRHSIWNKNLDNLDTVIPEMIQTSIQTIKEDVPNLQHTKIKKTDIAELIAMFPSNVMEELTNYLVVNPPNTYWDLLNVATWWATHQLNRNYESTHKLESGIYPKIMKLAKHEIAAA